MHRLHVFSNLLRILSILGTLFAGLCLLTPASAAVVEPNKAACEAAAVNQHFPKTQIDGGEDSAFIAAVVAMLDDFWRNEIHALAPEHFGMAAKGGAVLTWPKYEDLKVVLYHGSTRSAYGRVKNQMPFYSSKDKAVFISHYAFTSRLLGRLNRDSAWAYILAHEAGHHLQVLLINHFLDLGLKFTPGMRDSEGAFTTRMELQADCLAGFWIGRNMDLFSPYELAQISAMPSRLGGPLHSTGTMRDRWFHIGLRATTLSECGQVFKK